MTDSLQEAFFYGLFMDEEILRKAGTNPANPRKAHLENYGLKIGQRASLLPSEGDRSYGVVMSMSSCDLDKLYSEGSVADYVSEKVTVVTDQNETIEASCYNLPVELMAGSNATYAKSLLGLCQSLGFPASYLEHIQGFITSS